MTLDDAINAFDWVSACAGPLDVVPAIVDVRQIVFALERMRCQQLAAADRLASAHDYGAEFFAEDAERLREAIALLQARPVA